MAYEIESGVPIPDKGMGMENGNEKIYPFANMEVGQSFLVPPKDGETKTQLRERVSAAMTWAKRDGKRHYCSRSVVGGIRVWRIV